MYWRSVDLDYVSPEVREESAGHITWLELTFGIKSVENPCIPDMRTGYPWEPPKTVEIHVFRACPPKGWIL